MKPYIFIFLGLLLVSSIAFADEGSMLFSNLNGTQNISSLSVRVIPGASNFTSFRLYALDNNITNVALFSFSQKFNISIQPTNLSYVAAGDYRIITVAASVSNLTQAGVHTEPIIILSSRPEQRLLPLLIEVPETTSWSVSPNNLTLNVTDGQYGYLNVSLLNSGNVPISGHVSLLDTCGILWFDQSDFLIPQQGSLNRPLYFSARNLTPAMYDLNVSFIDTLNNVRTLSLHFMLPDTTPPSANISFSRSNVYPGQKVDVTASASDDVKVDSVQGRVGTGDTFNFSRLETGLYSIELSNLSVGDNPLFVFINDTSGNNITLNDSIFVSKFRYIFTLPIVNFYKQKLGTSRSVRILSTIANTPISIRLLSLVIENNINNSINVSLNSQPLSLNQEINMTLSGDVYISVEGAQNNTRFHGALGITTAPEVFNPSPEISFEGEFADYSVTPPENFSTNGIQRVCAPNDVGYYENSSYICTDKYGIDIDPETLLFCQSKASYDHEINGWAMNLKACEKSLGDTQGLLMLEGIFVFIFIVLAGLLLFYKRRHGSKLPLVRQ